MSYLFFVVLGYLSGSVMYSQLLPSLLRHADIRKISDDGNPGAGNVFKYLGAPLGIICLVGDIFKGTIPVALCLHFLSWDTPWFALVVAAPVLGHAKKGKAIAVSFGVLLGLLPFCWMLLYLVIPFICFSVLLRINPHSWRVILSFLCFLAAVFARIPEFPLRLSALLVTLIVVAKHISFAKAAHEKPHIDWGWDFSKLKNRH